MSVHSLCRLFIRRLWNSNVRLVHHYHAKHPNWQLKEIGGLRPMEIPSEDYLKWSTERLVDRVTFLEKELREQTIRYRFSQAKVPRSVSPRKSKNPRVNREFDPAKYSTRLIALKIAYLGQRYNGLEYHANNKTPSPTIEEELWRALNKARLIFPTPNPVIPEGEVNWEGCDFSKCGRTDKGVSAFGQVIAVRVRTNRPLNLERKNRFASMAATQDADHGILLSNDVEIFSPPLNPSTHQAVIPTATVDDDTSLSFHPINDEIPYMQVLNRLLPPDIRILAWCAAPPIDFSARFSCKERRYRYFFTQPAFAPTPGATGFIPFQTHSAPFNGRREGWLDIEAMRDGAKRFVGLHDFRNFCKVNPSKQLESFERRIFHADIEEADEGAHYIGLPGFHQHEGSTLNAGAASSSGQALSPRIYTFTLHGSAFLWHQVRHMVAILFLIGQGLESPNVVSELLDVQKHPQKPMYEMADDAPLVLWDCIFPREGSDPRNDALEWLYVGDSTGFEKGVAQAGGGNGNGKYGLCGVVDEMWKVWRQTKMDGILAGKLLDVIAGQGTRIDAMHAESSDVKSPDNSSGSTQKVFMGGNGPRLVGRKYVPILSKPRMETVETINAKYARRKGFETNEEIKQQGFRRVLLRLEEDGAI